MRLSVSGTASRFDIAPCQYGLALKQPALIREFLERVLNQHGLAYTCTQWYKQTVQT